MSQNNCLMHCRLISLCIWYLFLKGIFLSNLKKWNGFSFHWGPLTSLKINFKTHNNKNNPLQAAPLLFSLKACQAKKTGILIEVFPDNLMLIKYSCQWLQGNTSHAVLSAEGTFAFIKFQIKDRTKSVQELFSEIIKLKLHQPILMCPTIKSVAWELWKADKFHTGLSSICDFIQMWHKRCLWQ